MKRDYSAGVTDKITFFVGTEIEHTPAHNMRTLFVVGVQDTTEIIQLAKEHKCSHIYFGANQSFVIKDNSDWIKWNYMVKNCLEDETNFWCTLDFDVKYCEGLLDTGLTEYQQFIPQVSVKLPYLQLLGYNATIKLDDKDFKATNPGVWCHSLHSLMSRRTFTDWSQYTKDQIIK